MSRIAILGAGGFIGNRAVEVLHLSGGHEVVPVVHRPAALALAKRFPLDCRIADALDERALNKAFDGCDTVLVTVAGPSTTITGMPAPLVSAARSAGIRRIIYLSSQMVHGQAPAPGTSENTPLPHRHTIEYNRAKAEAERMLSRLTAAAVVELVMLRPGIVYGPRSSWTGRLADELLAGSAFLVSDSAAVCNAIYVDNIVHAIERAIDAPAAPGQVFIVNDDEEISWRDLIEPLADALGIDRAAIARPTSAEALGAQSSWANRHLEPIAKAAFRTLPKRIRHVLNAGRKAALETATPVEVTPRNYNPEMALLQSCTVRLSDQKARSRLNYQPLISHAEGMRRSIAWLRFAGYPVL